ncbi:MAG: hypothetical protein ACTSW1_14035 [Candidatus Hodarchaeales archaeon]
MAFQSIIATLDVLNKFLDQDYEIVVSPNQKIINIEITGQDIKLEPSPLLRQLLDKINYDFKRLDELDYQNFSYLITHIRAGKAALAFVKNFELVEHKVITKYMVRKKQGKAQYSYLTLKGKARGGAKLRLERTKEFFIEINQKLLSWGKEIEISDAIFYQCTPRLWDMVFKSKPQIFFSKNDPRIVKIPFTTYQPSLIELRRIKFYLECSKISSGSTNNEIDFSNYSKELSNDSKN